MENGDLVNETPGTIFVAKNEFYEGFWPRKRYNMSYTLMMTFDKKYGKLQSKQSWCSERKIQHWYQKFRENRPSKM